MIHSYAQEFEPDVAIEKMKSSRNWPRPEYMISEYNVGIIRALLSACSQDVVGSLMEMLENAATTKEQLCQEVQRLRDHVHCWQDLIKEFVLTDGEILKAWSCNSLRACTAGTWMHAMFEHALNGFDIRPGCMSRELSMCLRFLCDMANEFPKLRIYRTEWVIHAKQEDLAGSIDAVFIDEDDNKLLLVDWKRSPKLPSKYNSYGRRMLGPLSLVPDCQGQHYRLQLNIYKWILTQYYSIEVKSMTVVSTAPDASGEPFVDDVPDMQGIVSTLMSGRRPERIASKTSGPDLEQFESDQDEQHEPDIENDPALLPSVDGKHAKQSESAARELPSTIPFDVVLPSKRESQPDSHAIRPLRPTGTITDLVEAVEDEEEEVPQAMKKRRLLPGADSSAKLFSDFFRKAARRHHPCWTLMSQMYDKATTSECIRIPV